jgi:class 3 adenylate cyclase
MERVSQVLIRLYDVSCEPVVSEGAAEVISRYCDVTLFHTLLDLTRKEDTVTKIHGMRILKELAKRDKRVLMDVLTHRLYLLLEDREKDIQVEALFTLLELGDDYAVKILKDWLDSNDDELVTKVLIRVEKVMTDGLLHNVLNLIISEKVSIHERLREILPGLCSGEFSNKVKKILLEHLEAVHGTAHSVDRVRERAGFKEKESLISHPKAEFRFRREHSQILTVFFIDIAGYTDRSTRVDMSSLMLLVKTFEDIVVPHVEGYNGHIVKKMGDGILAAFRQPINAVLASLEIQEEVASHNRYTVDEERFFVRIGLHTGPVIRKEGDIYGDVVNLASRMESAANPGEIMITETVYNEVKDYIRCREIGKINVKGVREAIPAYMPERALEDTQKVLSTRSGDNSGLMNVNKNSSLLKLKESLFSPHFQLPKSLDQSQGMHLMLRELFEEMAHAVGEIAHDYHEEYVFKRYLQDKWDEMISKLKKSSE